MNKIALLLATTLFISSCASTFNSKNQKILLNVKKSDKVLINGKAPVMKKGKYQFARDMQPKQITIKSEGYLDENIVIMQYKKSPLYIISWVPFGVLLLMPPLMDVGPKSYDYTKDVSIPKRTPTLVAKNDDAKQIEINKISVELESDNVKYRYFPTYRNFLRKEEGKDTKSGGAGDKIVLENTIFSSVLNDLLKEKGYVDTTKRVFKNSYLNNLIINATVKDYTVHNVANRHYTQYGGMVYIDLVIDWEVLDYYKKTVHSQAIPSRSGQFAVLDYDNLKAVTSSAIGDAMESSFIEFMKSKPVIALMNDRSELAKESTFEELVLPKPKTFVNDVSQAIKSSVTIKTKDGHGSGFIISNDGYIITNYHMVSDPQGLKVIMNDESEHDVEIIRVSKIHDLALLKIEASQLLPFKISDAKDIEIASEIYAVGTPSSVDLSQTVSRGIISGVRKTDTDSRLIQTDASINGGNSGGAIITKEGLVLAVVSSKLVGYGIEGVAFGIPAYEIFDKLKIRMD